MAAIVEARSKGIDLRGASVYVFRRGLSGKIAIARPCKSCMMALTEVGVGTIIYTTDVGMAKEFVGG
jgi:deoxycytidylate deaminase